MKALRDVIATALIVAALVMLGCAIQAYIGTPL